jgi:hypothetical protein
MFAVLEKILNERQSTRTFPKTGLLYNSRGRETNAVLSRAHVSIEIHGFPSFREFPDVGISCPVGCYLRLPKEASSGDLASISRFFGEQVIENPAMLHVLQSCSVMSFLSQEGHEIPPRRAFQYGQQLYAPGDLERVSHDRERAEAETAAGRARVDKPMRDGVWYHPGTKTAFPIIDRNTPQNPHDAPILALGNNLHRVLAVSANSGAWYDQHPPPQPPVDARRNGAYHAALRSYLKKLSLNLIERDGWILFWRAHCYLSGIGIGDVNIHDLCNRTILRQIAANAGYDAADPAIHVYDAQNNHELGTVSWQEFKTLPSLKSAGLEAGGGRAVGKGIAEVRFLKIFHNTGLEISRAFPSLFAKPGIGEDITLTGDILSALVEAHILMEALTYNQMLTATQRFWQTRLKTVRNVYTQPPSLVVLKDGTVNLSFNFVSHPSTEGRPHKGFVKFIPNRGQPTTMDKVKALLGKLGRGLAKMIGKKIPPQILKGSDLRKMLVEVTCDCKDFLYRMSYANVKAGVTSQAGRTDNGQPPDIRNPAQHPGFCKHILATVRYLTTDAEIQISREFTKEQQEALKKDRAQFIQDSQKAYEAMEAPAPPEEEEEEKPEEEPPTPGLAEIPPPPTPETPARPATPPAPAPPPAPNYPVSGLS